MSEMRPTEIEMVENPRGPSQGVSCLHSFRGAHIILVAKNKQQYEEMPPQYSRTESPPAAADEISESGQGAHPFSNINGNHDTDANSQRTALSTRPVIQPQPIVSVAEMVAEASRNAQTSPISIDSGLPNSSYQVRTRSSLSREISENAPTAAHPTGLWHFIPRASFLPGPISATVLVIVVAAITFHANSLSWPLARITVPMGIFLLTVFSKLLDFFLAWAADTVWEKVKWGPLMEDGERLLTFLALSASPTGWMKILFLRHGASAADSPSRVNNIVGFFHRHSPRMWSLIRCALGQGYWKWARF